MRSDGRNLSNFSAADSHRRVDEIACFGCTAHGTAQLPTLEAASIFPDETSFAQAAYNSRHFLWNFSRFFGIPEIMVNLAYRLKAVRYTRRLMMSKMVSQEDRPSTPSGGGDDDTVEPSHRSPHRSREPGLIAAASDGSTLS